MFLLILFCPIFYKAMSLDNGKYLLAYFLLNDLLSNLHYIKVVTIILFPQQMV